MSRRCRHADRAAPLVIETPDGSFLEPSWRDRNVRAIMFDSCPPKSDVYAFGGWLAWLIRAKTGLPPAMTKPVVSQLFHPVRPLFGITPAWTTSNDERRPTTSDVER